MNNNKKTKDNYGKDDFVEMIFLKGEYADKSFVAINKKIYKKSDIKSISLPAKVNVFKIEWIGGQIQFLSGNIEIILIPYNKGEQCKPEEPPFSKINDYPLNKDSNPEVSKYNFIDGIGMDDKSDMNYYSY